MRQRSGGEGSSRSLTFPHRPPLPYLLKHAPRLGDQDDPPPSLVLFANTAQIRSQAESLSRLKCRPVFSGSWHYTVGCPKAGVRGYPQATHNTPTPRRSKAAAPPFQGCAAALIRCRSPPSGQPAAVYLRCAAALQKRCATCQPVGQRPTGLSPGQASLGEHRPGAFSPVTTRM